MPTTIKNVALAGATGNLGAPVLSALLSANIFNITVLTRTNSDSTFPPTVKVARVDYNSITSLTAALQGQDAVISNVNSAGVEQQQLLIDAAVSAGVQRFIPSEFGCDTTNPKAAQLPVYKSKVETAKYLEAKAQESGLTYTLVLNSAFLDWGVRVGFLIDLKNKKLTRFDGGDNKFSATRLSTVGQGVVGVLKRPEETANRAVRIHDCLLTQNQLLGIAQRVVGAEGWTVDDKKTAETERQAYEMLASGKGESIGLAMMTFLMSGAFREGYGGGFEQTDNTLLGIEGMSEGDVEELVKKIAAGM
ncbi:hypothetical protein MBLNU230_g3512t1 [Neophaeotheca triangularis]